MKSVAFSPDGRRAVSGSEDTTALVWDLRPPPAGVVDPDACWANLAADDAAVAFAAMRRLAAAPERAKPFLAERARTPAADADRVAKLIAALDDRSFRTRETAAKELESLGEAASPLVRKALLDQRSAEARNRLQALVGRLDRGSLNPPPEVIRRLRAAEVLGWIDRP